MNDLTNYETFFHTQRSFNINENIDPTFLSEVKDIINQYIEEFDMLVYTDIVTDKREIKILYSVAIHEFDDNDLAWRTNTQMLAPLLINITPKIRNDPISLIHIGRLYSQIGLNAINFGYRTGFCLCINLKALKGYKTMIKYIHYHNNVEMQMVWLCIGKPYDITKYHGYSHIHDKTFAPKKRLRKDHIKVNYEQ